MFMILGMKGLGMGHMGHEAQYYVKTRSGYGLLRDEKL